MGLCSMKVIIGSSKLTSTIDPQTAPPIMLNNNSLQYCKKVKNLGLTINSSLTWSDHIVSTCNKVFAGIHSLKKFYNCFPIDLKVMLVKTLIFPHLDYCDVVINDMTEN